MQTNIEDAISQQEIKRYIKSDWSKSTWQIINSIIPYLLLIAGMYWSLSYSYILTLILAVPAAGFLIRIFIIFHDCGHGSFFTSTRLNTFFGTVAGLLTFVPYHQWRHDHARHHATCSDLDRRGTGDIWTLTVREYETSPRWSRFMYCLYRNPIIMFGLGPAYSVLIANRRVTKGAKKRERRSVHVTNAALFLIILAISLAIGLKSYLLIQIPVLMLAWSAGIWLFYVQHQFEDVYWERHENWNFHRAALLGSSFYKLPLLLQWFTGNIGFHHVHHYNSRIPNYNLQQCHEQIPGFKSVRPITLLKSLSLMRLRLYDETRNCMISSSG